MNYSIDTADHATHVRIVVIAIAISTMVALIVLAAH